MVKQYGQLLRETRARLRPTEGKLAAQTARELLAMASGKTVAALLTDQELYASEPIEARLGDLTERIVPRDQHIGRHRQRQAAEIPLSK